MNTVLLLSIIFYFIGIVAIMLGSYSLYINPKETLNQTFFAMCISFSLWAIGFSMAIDATTMIECLFWRRFAAIGWSTLFAFLVHFCMAFTNKSQLLKKWWSYLLIYVPAAVILYVFSLSNQMAPHQYHLMRTNFGWINVSSNNLWDTIFNLYYIGYVAIGLLFVWDYGRKSSIKSIKRQVKLIIYPFVCTFLLGTISDILVHSIFLIRVPQIAPLLILLPIVTTYYSIDRFGFMKPMRAGESEIILTKASQKQIYISLSRALMVGSVIIFCVQFFSHQNLGYAISTSAIILLVGFIIRIIKNLKITDYIKNGFLVILLFVSIPTISVIFIKEGGITAWAVAFFFIVTSMVFHRVSVLITVSISAISTQLLLWIMEPKFMIELNYLDYLGRIAILIITIANAYYINKLFIQRLKINAEQLNYQKFISEVSSDLIQTNQYNIEEKMNWILRVVGKLFLIDRINIVTIHTKTYTLNYTVCYRAKKAEVPADPRCELSKEDIGWLTKKLLRNDYLYVSEIEEISNQAVSFKNWMKCGGIHSFLAIPLIDKGESAIILQFLSLDKHKTWKEDEIRVLTIISNMLSDAMTKVEVEKEVSFQANHDFLTELPNRYFLYDKFSESIRNTSRTFQKVGIVLINLDDFKAINEMYGHEYGDRLLIIIANKLLKTVRREDVVSRFNGDEYVIMLPNLDRKDEITAIVEDIQKELQQSISVEGRVQNIRTSIGISVFPEDGMDLDSLIKNADIAISKAKENGKNQYVFCTDALKSEATRKSAITNMIYHALDKNEFYLQYQPQVQLETGSIIGVEALIRWNNEELGFLSPGEFIPIAEQSGVIREIGEWVLKTACLQNKKWQLQGLEPIRMAVNVSLGQMRDMRFVERVEEILKETDMDARFLELEITESTVMNDSCNVIEIINQLKQKGVLVSIDDFGTDYSSLNRLTELSIDKLKIDKKFVDRIDASGKDNAIVRAIINLAKILEISVIAEGAEQEYQVDFLKEEACDEIQGYYYYRPMLAQEVEMHLCKSKQ